MHNKINLDETVIVRSRQDVVDWCNKHNITVAEFNQPVIIPKDVTDCSRMFEDCESFHQTVIILEGVIDCDSMFCGCRSFNQSIKIPSTVKYYSMMFLNCDSIVSDIIVADILGVSKRTIESYEYGNREPSIEMLCKLADLYGVSIDYLFGRIGSKEPILIERDKAFLKAYESSPMRDAIDTLLNIKSEI